MKKNFKSANFFSVYRKLIKIQLNSLSTFVKSSKRSRTFCEAKDHRIIGFRSKRDDSYFLSFSFSEKGKRRYKINKNIYDITNNEIKIAKKFFFQLINFEKQRI